MFTAGYLIGYINESLRELFTDTRILQKYTKQILNGIFPGVGADFIVNKASARMLGDTISSNYDKYSKVHPKIEEFDLGVSAAIVEVHESEMIKGYISAKLEIYLTKGYVE